MRHMHVIPALWAAGFSCSKSRDFVPLKKVTIKVEHIPWSKIRMSLIRNIKLTIDIQTDRKRRVYYHNQLCKFYFHNTLQGIEKFQNSKKVIF